MQTGQRGPAGSDAHWPSIDPMKERCQTYLDGAGAGIERDKLEKRPSVRAGPDRPATIDGASSQKGGLKRGTYGD